ncbi:MAG: gephyrin-like molybdotransferase Glp [Desulfomonilaceae bacterium]
MISFEEARRQVLARVPILGSERVTLLEGLGRVLAREVTASRDVPHEGNSAMDGYAVRHEDVTGASNECPARLRVIGESLAGRPYADRVGPGQAVRIMTGGLIPLGADTVVMSEASSAQGDAVELAADPGAGANVRIKGQYVHYGEVLLNPGDLIGPSEVGILATLGMPEVDVHKRAVVAVLSTGDELVDLDQPLGPDKVYSSNAYSLAAQVMECGGVAISLGTSSDNEKELAIKLSAGLSSDALVTSGGVSIGRHDLVKQALSNLGMELVFWKVAMKPGKPFLFGMFGQKPVFGLPGNPGAATISFEQFVRPALLRMMGHQELLRPVAEAELAGESVARSDRIHFIRCGLEVANGVLNARVIPKLKPAMIRTTVAVDGLIVVEPGNGVIEPGEKVTVQIL